MAANQAGERRSAGIPKQAARILVGHQAQLLPRDARRFQLLQERAQPLRRRGVEGLAEIADVAVFLASAEARAMTGAVVEVSGWAG